MNHHFQRLCLASALTLSASSTFAFDLNGSLTDSTGLGAKASQLAGTASGQAAKALRQGRGAGDANGFRMTGTQGRAAGDRMGGITPWIAYAHNSGKADTGLNSGTDHLNIEADTIQWGGDKVLDGKYLVGVSMASERSDITNRYGNKQDSEGLSIMPYFGWLISPQLLLDATVGYSDIEHDINNNDPLHPPASNSNGVDADRKFAEVNINYFRPVADHTEVSARAGLLWAEEDTESHSSPDAITASPSQELGITQLKLGGQISHQYARVTPYAGLTYIRDLSISETLPPGTSFGSNCKTDPLCVDPEDDKDGWLAVVGVTGVVKEGVFLDAEWVHRYDRESLDDTTLNFSVRVNF